MTLAVRFAEENNIEYEAIGKFLVEVDRLKSSGKLSDLKILVTAYRNVVK